MVQTFLCQRINMMFHAIVGTNHPVWEKQTEQGLWGQVILVNANIDKTEV